MKKVLGKIFIFAFVICIALCSTVTAFAESTVTYEGDSQKFVFAPGSKNSPTDLFTDIKNVMPGDIVTQKITVNNKISNKIKIKLYIKSLGATENEELLSQLKLSVKQDGNSVLFDATADETAQLTDWVCLGTFYSGAKINLDVTLSVPIELDTKYQDQLATLDWQFKVEELPIEPDDPQTGQSWELDFYIVLACVSVIALLVLAVLRRRKTVKE